jgi:RNA recognition motif-containing protein
MKIYVGKLSLKVNEDDLKQAFEAYGKVEEAKIIKDKYTGESRGFAFIEMPTQTEALAAISGLNGKELQGDTIVVNEARARSEGQDRGGRGKSY